MGKKTLNNLGDLHLAYSTHSDSIRPLDSTESEDFAKNTQQVRVQRFSKLKGGKSVSRIYGLQENASQLEYLCKFIKQKCGLGGTVKDGEILIQGDQVEKIIKILVDLGYSQTKRSGG